MTMTTVDPTTMTAGDEFAVTGLRGRFRFIRVTVNDAGEVVGIDSYGPINTQRAKLRSFHPERVSKIHRNRTETR